MNKKEFYTSREAAELLGVALSTVQLWTENGILRAWKTGGGHRRIARQSVEDFLLQQRMVAEDVPEYRPANVVVVEDKPELLKLYKRQFAARELPVKLITAGNGFEGLVQIGRFLPDVVITDLLMPGMDGFQMLESLRGMTELAKTMTLVVSALSPDEISGRGGLPGDTMYFQKPVDFEVLAKLICKHIEQLAIAV